MNSNNTNALNEMMMAGIIGQTTPNIVKHLSEKRSIYCGFDATAPSLAVGNLAVIISLSKLGRDGHNIILLVGGITTLIGDPSGRSDERPILDISTVENNKLNIISQLKKLGSLCVGKPVKIVDNSDWYSKMYLTDYMQDIASNIRMSRLASLESIKVRESRSSSGLTMKELMYSTLQGFDFVYLNKEEGCTVQFAGVDQWGNIVSGIQMSSSLNTEELHAITIPLVCDNNGNKFGKSDNKPIFLDPKLTSPFSFHQFFLKQADTIVESLLRIYTFLSEDEISNLMTKHIEAPGLKVAQNKLADSVTMLVHGKDGLEFAKECAHSLFGKTSSSISKGLLKQLCSDNTVGHTSERTISLDRLLVNSCLATSLNRAREFIRNGAISINGTKHISNSNISDIELIEENFAIIKKGKKTVKAVRFI